MVRSILGLVAVATVSAQDVFLANPQLKTVESARTALPPQWQGLGASPPEKMLELIFAVKQQNVGRLQEELLAVSTPSSPRYGQHLSNEQVHELVAPKADDVAAVLAHLESFGVQGVKATPNADIITAQVPVSLAEQILATKYEAIQHSGTNKTVHRALGGYRLPHSVASAVDFVSPTVHLPGGDRKPQFQAESSASYNTPKNLRQLYSMEDPVDGGEFIGAADANKMAVTAFLKQYYSQADLQQFWSTYCTGISCGDGLPKLVGDATTGSAGVESMLDIETITGIVGGIESEFWGYSGNSPDNPENEPFMKWLAEVASTPDDQVPLVFSTSYGEDESSWSEPAAQRLNTEFMKTGARGISILFASGDEGANCKNGAYIPETPSSSPWVTAVGGTGPASGFPAPGSETAVGLSSGGFSDYFAMPDYQKDAVAAYLQQSGIPDVTKYQVNTSGRAYPDIAAQATNFCVTPFGCGIAGTSCATPAASGIIAALNDARLAAGKSSLGFLNPLLYSLPASSFQDITTGSGSGCLFSSGWPAKDGWDAVTGLGTLNFKNMVAAVLELP
jgi:tripeptidyl-peptidase-1